jgi:hypothetical protein
MEEEPRSRKHIVLADNDPEEEAEAEFGVEVEFKSHPTQIVPIFNGLPLLSTLSFLHRPLQLRL